MRIEKIVVGVAAAAFLGVLTLQFVGHPNSVKIGTGKTEKVVPIDQAFDVVAEHEVHGLQDDELAEEQDEPHRQEPNRLPDSPHS